MAEEIEIHRTLKYASPLSRANAFNCIDSRVYSTIRSASQSPEDSAPEVKTGHLL